MARVELNNLCKHFAGPDGRRLSALSHATLTAEDGELLVLVGPSGAGKTTLLRLVAGLEMPSSGTVLIDGLEVTRLEPHLRDVAMVFQNHALYPHMTAGENMAFGLKLRKTPKPEIERRVRQAAGMLGIASCLDRKPEALSGGERQRVAVGRAIVRQPKVFLFDEPLSNLDAPRRVQLRGEISQLQRRFGTTLLYVTHDQAEAMALGDRIVVLKDGFIQQTADPLTLYHQPANLFVAGFIGSPPMNLLRGRILAQGGALWFGTEGVPGGEGETWRVKLGAERPDSLSRFVGRPVICGVRAENLKCGDSGSGDDGAGSGVLERIEITGADTHLHVRILGQPVVARIGGATSRKIGEKLRLALDPGGVRFFDPASQSAIG